MKKLLSLFAIALLLIGCNSAPNELNDINEETNPNLELIASMGFDVSGIVDMGDSYLVEGDIAIDKEDLESYGPGTRQRYFSKINYTIVQAISIGFDSSLPYAQRAQWQQAIQEAIAAWNSVPDCLINFYYTDNNPRVKVSFENFAVTRPSTHQNGTIAVAGYPILGIPRYIVFNTNFSWYLDCMTYTFIHEMGHNLGIQHPDETTGTYVPGTPDIQKTGNWDKASVMHPMMHPPFTGFTQYDIMTVQYMYPLSILCSDCGQYPCICLPICPTCGEAHEVYPILSVYPATTVDKYEINKTYRIRIGMVPEAVNPVIITAYNKNIYAPTPILTGPAVARFIDILFRAPGEYVVKADYVDTVCDTSVELEITVPEEEPDPDPDPDPVLTLNVSPSTVEFYTNQTYRFTTTMTPDESGRAIEMIAYNNNNPNQTPIITRFPNNDRMIDVSFTHEGEYVIKANFANAASENTAVQMMVSAINKIDDNDIINIVNQNNPVVGQYMSFQVKIDGQTAALGREFMFDNYNGGSNVFGQGRLVSIHGGAARGGDTMFLLEIINNSSFSINISTITSPPIRKSITFTPQ